MAAPYFFELVIADALSKARHELIERCKAVAQQNFPIVKDWINLNSQYLSWIPPDGGVLCFPKFESNHNFTSTTLGRNLMAEHGILISPGEYFGLDGHFRMSYMLPENELNYALEKIAKLITQN